jgi:hypothetical protein
MAKAERNRITSLQQFVERLKLRRIAARFTASSGYRALSVFQ